MEAPIESNSGEFARAVATPSPALDSAPRSPDAASWEDEKRRMEEDFSLQRAKFKQMYIRLEERLGAEQKGARDREGMLIGKLSAAEEVIATLRRELGAAKADAAFLRTKFDEEMERKRLESEEFHKALDVARRRHAEECASLELMLREASAAREASDRARVEVMRQFEQERLSLLATIERLEAGAFDRERRGVGVGYAVTGTPPASMGGVDGVRGRAAGAESPAGALARDLHDAQAEIATLRAKLREAEAGKEDLRVKLRNVTANVRKPSISSADASAESTRAATPMAPPPSQSVLVPMRANALNTSQSPVPPSLTPGVSPSPYPALSPSPQPPPSRPESAASSASGGRSAVDLLLFGPEAASEGVSSAAPSVPGDLSGLAAVSQTTLASPSVADSGINALNDTPRPSTYDLIAAEAQIFELRQELDRIRTESLALETARRDLSGALSAAADESAALRMALDDERAARAHLASLVSAAQRAGFVQPATQPPQGGQSIADSVGKLFDAFRGPPQRPRSNTGTPTSEPPARAVSPPPPSFVHQTPAPGGEAQSSSQPLGFLSAPTDMLRQTGNKIVTTLKRVGSSETMPLPPAPSTAQAGGSAPSGAAVQHADVHGGSLVRPPAVVPSAAQAREAAHDDDVEVNPFSPTPHAPVRVEAVPVFGAAPSPALAEVTSGTTAQAGDEGVRQLRAELDAALAAVERLQIERAVAESSLSDLKVELDATKAGLSGICGENEVLRKSLAALQAELDAAKKRGENMAFQSEGLGRAHQKTVAELEAARKELDAMRAAREDVDVSRDVAIQESETLRAQVEELRRVADELRARIDDAECGHAEAVSDAQAARAELARMISRMEETERERSTLASETAEQIKSFEAQHATLEGQFSEIQGAIAAAETFKRAAADMSRRLEEANTALAATREDVKHLAAEREDLLSSLVGLRDRRQREETEWTAFRARLEGELAQAKRSVEAQKDANAALEKRLLATQKELTTLQKAAEGAPKGAEAVAGGKASDAEVTELRGRCEDMKREIGVLRESLASERRAAEEMRRTLDESANAAASLREALSQRDAERKALDGKMGELEETYRRMKAKSRDVIVALQAELEVLRGSGDASQASSLTLSQTPSDASVAQDAPSSQQGEDIEAREAKVRALRERMAAAREKPKAVAVAPTPEALGASAAPVRGGLRSASDESMSSQTESVSSTASANNGGTHAHVHSAPRPNKAEHTGGVWESDADVTACRSCNVPFSVARRKHHCRVCGRIFCAECSSRRIDLTDSHKAARVCDSCFARVSARRRQSATRPVVHAE